MSVGLNIDWQEFSQNNPKIPSLDALQVPQAYFEHCEHNEKGINEVYAHSRIKTCKFHFGRVQTELLKHLF